MNELHDHLYRLSDPTWALWRQAAVRSAGFPVNLVLRLAVPECAQAADQLIEAEVVLEQNRQRAVAMFRLGEQKAAPEERPLFARVLRLLRKRRVPSFSELCDPYRETLERLHTAAAYLDTLSLVFEQKYHVATVQVAQVIHEVAQNERFREAVTWQNRQVIHKGITPLLRLPPEFENAKVRRKRELVARYLQRYCTKNETVGFFGPVGWAQLVAMEEPILVCPGPDLLAARSVYFEEWGINLLARTLAADPALRPWLIPRLVPNAHLEDNRLYLPFAKPLFPGRNEMAVLLYCDGEHTAREIAHSLLADPTSTLKDEEEIYTILTTLKAQRRISWSLEIPPEGAHPENDLRSLLVRIEDEHLRQAGEEALAKMQTARDRAADAAGNAVLLNTALEDLETLFSDLTRNAPTRSAGDIYAARTLVYEDCRRAVEVQVGSEVIQALGEPLSLLLTSARWLSYMTAHVYRQGFMDAFHHLSQKDGSGSVDFAEFWLWVHLNFLNKEHHLISSLLPLFQQKWASVLEGSGTGDERCRHYRSAELRERVQALFAAPGPGWSGARYHTPDVMILASSSEAIGRGEYQLVLGEFHIAMNTLRSSGILTQHTAPEELLHYTVLDLPEPQIIPVASREQLPASRVRPALIAEKDIRLLFATDTPTHTARNILTTGSLIVRYEENALVVCSRDGQQRFDILDLFAFSLSEILCTCFHPFASKPHQPRVSIDRLVVKRESWTFLSHELIFVNEKSPAERFIAIRRWVRTQGIPRFVFLRVPAERKPYFIDFESPIAIEMFVRQIHQIREGDEARVNQDRAQVTLSEMLPSPEEAWLSDAQGQHYTSELRIVAVDHARSISFPQGQQPGEYH